jgi:hypothetical protein
MSGKGKGKGGALHCSWLFPASHPALLVPLRVWAPLVLCKHRDPHRISAGSLNRS